jgi:hypothetical protein
MARLTIYWRAMTDAERMRRYRAHKRDPQPRPPTMREQAQRAKVSERTLYYSQVAQTLGWGTKFWRNYVTDKYGDPVGIQFLAELAQYGTPRAQDLVRVAIERQGGNAARTLWRKLIRRGQRYAELRRRRAAAAEYRRHYEKHGPRPRPWWLRDRPG